MTQSQEKFIKKLKREDYPYEIEGDKVVVTDRRSVDLESLTSLPPGVVFKNKSYVNLESLTSLPPGVEFKNGGNVYLNSLTSLPPGVVFKNEGEVILDSLTSLPSGVVFENGGDVNLGSLIGDYSNRWSGNIKGVDSKRLLNSMIKQGIFI